MNNTENYLRKMTPGQVQELWKEIDGKTELENYRNRRSEMTKNVEEFSKARKLKVAEEEKKKDTIYLKVTKDLKYQ